MLGHDPSARRLARRGGVNECVDLVQFSRAVLSPADCRMRSHSATQSRANHLPETGFPNPSFTMQSMVDDSAGMMVIATWSCAAPVPELGFRSTPKCLVPLQRSRQILRSADACV